MRDLTEFLDTGLMSIKEPSRGAVRILRAGYSVETVLTALVSIAALSALLTSFTVWAFPLESSAPFAGLVERPLLTASVQAGGMVYVAAAMVVMGRLFGGQGGFRAALTLAVWTEAILLAVQALQAVLMLVFPLIASLLGLVSMGLLFWLITGFTATLHGFKNRFLVFLGVLLGLFLSGVLLLLVLGIFGASPAAPL